MLRKSATHYQRVESQNLTTMQKGLSHVISNTFKFNNLPIHHITIRTVHHATLLLTCTCIAVTAAD